MRTFFFISGRPHYISKHIKVFSSGLLNNILIIYLLQLERYMLLTAVNFTLDQPLNTVLSHSRKYLTVLCTNQINNRSLIFNL